jgi:flagellar hook-associated protein 3 FlgL
VSEIAISSADGTKTAEDRAGMAEELEQLLQHLVQVGNTTQGGRYIFSGGKTDTPAFRGETDANTGRITGVFYDGDSSVREVKTKDGGTVKLNTLGSNAGNPDKRGTFIDNNQDVNTFDTMIRLRDKLLANDIIGISGSGGIIEEIDTSARNIAAAQTSLGGSQEILTLDKNRIIEDTATFDQHLSDVEDADTVKLILELNNVQNVYEAALAAGGRLLQTGLLNFI